MAQPDIRLELELPATESAGEIIQRPDSEEATATSAAIPEVQQAQQQPVQPEQTAVQPEQTAVRPEQTAVQPEQETVPQQGASSNGAAAETEAPSSEFTPEEEAIFQRFQMPSPRSSEAENPPSPEKPSPGLWGTVKDTVAATVNSPYKAMNELFDKAYSTSMFVADVATNGWDAARFRELKAPLRFDEYNPETVIGGMAQGIGQWVTGFVTLGAVGKVASAVTGVAIPVTNLAAKAAAFAARGAATDMLFFDTQEERVSNLVEQVPALRNPVTNFLKARPDDPMPEAMLKRAAEGLGLGVLSGSLIKGLKCLRSGARTLNGKPNPNFNPAQFGSDVAEAARAQNTPAPPPPPALNAGEVKEIIDKAAKETTPLKGIGQTVNLNHEIFDKPGGSHLLYELSEKQAANTLKAKGPQDFQTLFTETAEELKGLGIKGGDLGDALAGQGATAVEAMQQATRSMLIVRNIIHNLQDAAYGIAERISANTASLQDAAHFIQITKNLQEFQALNADMRTTAGRLLNSRKMQVSDASAGELAGVKDADAFIAKWYSPGKLLTNDAAREFIEKSGIDPTALRETARSVLIANDRAGALAQIKQLKPDFSLSKAAIECRMNGMLSGPTTHMVNVIGSAANITLAKPLERTIGGAMTLNPTEIRKGWNLFRATFSMHRDIWNIAYKALRLGDSILDKGSGTLEQTTHAISYERIRNSWLKGKADDAELSPIRETLARSLGWIGTVIRIPSRLLVTEDELFKQLAFRNSLCSDLMEEGIGKGLKGKDLKEYARARVQDYIAPDGTILVPDEEITRKALAFARDSTWTTNLPQGSFGQSLQQMANNHAAVKLAAPFVRTPMNLYYDAVRHTPFAPFTKQCRQAWKEGGEARAEMLGRMATGGLLMAAGVWAAAEGRVTGAYPENPKLKALWQENSIKPYSIRIGDTWIEYRRFDPAGLIFGASVDAWNYVQNHDDESQDNALDTATRALQGAGTAVINNLNDKTYVQGVADLMAAMTHPDRYLEQYVNRTVTSFIPLGSFFRSISNSVMGAELKETEGLLEYMQNAVPGFRNSLPPKYSWLTGEIKHYPGSIISDAKADEKHGKVLRELLTLGESVMGAPPRKIRGVELSSEQYSRLCELHGAMKLRGKTLSESLSELLESPLYDFERQRFGDGLPGADSPRSTLVNKVIHYYREEAIESFLEEYPDLKERIREAEITSRGSKKGVFTDEESKARKDIAKLLD